MPVLSRDVDLFPDNLLDRAAEPHSPAEGWYALYTLSRRDKELMRKLRSREISFYGPTIAKRSRTPRGRVFESHMPLFPNYVFLFGDEMARYEAVRTGCVSQSMHVVDGDQLTDDLRQIWQLIDSGAQLTPESRLQAGRRVRVRSGQFRGLEGVILRREGKTRLLVSVQYLAQGASMLLEDCDLEDLGSSCPVVARSR